MWHSCARAGAICKLAVAIAIDNFMTKYYT